MAFRRQLIELITLYDKLTLNIKCYIYVFFPSCPMLSNETMFILMGMKLYENVIIYLFNTPPILQSDPSINIFYLFVHAYNVLQFNYLRSRLLKLWRELLVGNKHIALEDFWWLSVFCWTCKCIWCQQWIIWSVLMQKLYLVQLGISMHEIISYILTDAMQVALNRSIWKCVKCKCNNWHHWNETLRFIEYEVEEAWMF